MAEQNSRIANNFDNYLRKESLSIIKYVESLTLTPTLTTSEGDIVVLSKSSIVIKNKRRLVSLLDSSKGFTKLQGQGRVIRYDSVEALYRDGFEKNNDKENQYQDEKDLPTLPQSDQHLALNTLNTILWVPQNDEVGDTLKTRNSTSNNNIKKETYIPYRVLGNLSISGKNLIIDCLSDRLLKNCNEIIQSLAGKYLTYVGDTYKELPYPSIQTENEDDYDDHHLDNHDEEPDTVKQQIYDYFQN